MSKKARVSFKLIPSPKLTSLRGVKKFCDNPRCLDCDYELRGHFKAGLTQCPECGQTCDATYLADRVSRQLPGYLPVLTEVRSGMLCLWGLSITVGLLFMIMAGMITLVMDPDVVLGVTVGVGVALACIAVLAWSAWTAYRAYESPRGVWLWGLSLIHGLASTSLVLAIAGWLILWAIAGVTYLDRGDVDGDLAELLLTVWFNAAIAGAVVLFVLNGLWYRRVVIAPCRARCRELMLVWFEIYQAGLTEPGPSSSSAQTDTRQQQA